MDPSFAGAGTVNFTFNIEDAAHQSSAAAATVTLNFTALSFSGTVFNDTNGLGEGVVNGTGTNAGGTVLISIGPIPATKCSPTWRWATGQYNFTNLMR